jgi:hypothetical protein
MSLPADEFIWSFDLDEFGLGTGFAYERLRGRAAALHELIDPAHDVGDRVKGGYSAPWKLDAATQSRLPGHWIRSERNSEDLR